jgi:peptide/nickel transport system permease protein
MLKFITRRLLQLIPVLFILSVLVFSLVHLVPGSPIDVLMGEGRDPVVEAALMARYGLDQPLPVQYWTWLTNLLQGDFGISMYSREPILQMILARFPNTLLLAFASAIVALAISLPAGIIAALYQNRLPDFGAMGIALAGISIPNFWFGILLVLLFSQYLGWLPSMGYVSPAEDFGAAMRHLILPAITLGTAMAANLTRLIRAEMIEQLSQDYVRTARAKGLGERMIVGVHVSEERHDPDRHDHRHPVRRASRRRGPDRGDLRLARHRAARRRCRLRARLRADPGRRSGRGHRLRADQPLVDISYRYLDPRVKLG